MPIGGKKPTKGEVLGADGKALDVSLVFGGAYTPMDGVGQSLLQLGHLIDSSWWPY